MLTGCRYSVEGVVASVLFLVLIGVVLLQVFGRLGLFAGPVWTEELARWIWVWMAFLAVGEAERTNNQLRMSFFSEFLPARMRKILFTGVDIIYLGVTCHLCWIGYKTVKRTWYNESVTLPVPDAFLYFSYVVASLFIIWRIVNRLTRGLPCDVTRKDKEESP